MRSGIFYIRGKGYKDCEVPLNAEICSGLEDYLADRTDDSPYVFVSQRSKRLVVRAVQHLVEKCHRRIRIEHLTCHTLRHSFEHDLVVAKTDL